MHTTLATSTSCHAHHTAHQHLIHAYHTGHQHLIHAYHTGHQHLLPCIPHCSCHAYHTGHQHLLPCIPHWPPAPLAMHTTMLLPCIPHWPPAPLAMHTTLATSTSCHAYHTGHQHLIHAYHTGHQHLLPCIPHCSCHAYHTGHQHLLPCIPHWPPAPLAMHTTLATSTSYQKGLHNIIGHQHILAYTSQGPSDRISQEGSDIEVTNTMVEQLH
jgi:hypothetical protein